jgi:hypothetical protein
LSSSYKNPADTTDAQGVRTTIVSCCSRRVKDRPLTIYDHQDGTSFWNGQTMERTEILPQTNAPINAGHVYYHFSMSTSATNAPNPKFEHQIAFFEVRAMLSHDLVDRSCSLSPTHRATLPNSSTASCLARPAPRTTPCAGW